MGIHSDPFENVTNDHLKAAYWLDDATADTPILSPEAIVAHNAKIAYGGNDVTQRFTLSGSVDRAKINNQINYAKEQIQKLQLVTADGQAPNAAHLKQYAMEQGRFLPTPTIHMTQSRVQMRCGPLNAALFTDAADPSYDKNACSNISPFEPFRIIAHWNNELLLVQTSYATGWIPAATSFSKDIPAEYLPYTLDKPGYRSTKELLLSCGGGPPITIPANALLPAGGDHRALLATHDQLCILPATPSLISTARPLTKRALLTVAFSYLNAPYGLGGQNGGIDCSRFTMNLFSLFNLLLPRTSAWQSRAGSYTVDLAPDGAEEIKLKIIDAANTTGVVLLYLPGHIMLYLGRDKNGVPMAIHALGEYAKPCAKGNTDTVFRPHKVVVTDLNVGRGSNRKSFIERITKVVVFSDKIPQYLNPVAIPATAAYPMQIPETCTDSLHQRIFQSPRAPRVNRPVRIIATGNALPDNARLQIFSPQHTPINPRNHRLKGPPTTQIVTFTPTETGEYTAVWGDNNTVLACDTFPVYRYRFHHTPPTAEAPYWPSRWKWEADTENLFSAFVEHLFAGSAPSNASWNGLHHLLRDPQRNLLFDHLGQREDAEITLTPDCADLPYVLRAYFAWKTALPFAVRKCTRGKPDSPPVCNGETASNMDPNGRPNEELTEPHKMFEHFATRIIGWSAHSGSARTAPDDDETDFYPVDLTSDAITPGTIFADPYGHVLIVAEIVRQVPGSFGQLIAADGQPDSTIGKRTFWRGSFLFTPDTTFSGAGFKKFRPVKTSREAVVELTDEGEQEVHTVSIAYQTNAELRRSHLFEPFSMAQYRIDTDAFYDAIQSILNPFEVSPLQLINARVKALHETVLRRVSAIENGEAYLQAHDGKTIGMPEGHDIFETEGAWENYSTPSRDMRLLVSIDAVMRLSSLFARNPEKYGIQPTDVDQLRNALMDALESHKFTYHNSRNQEVTLNLKAIVDRQEELEMAYNPNDCAEIRWGASGKELESCKRHAPIEQRNRMATYRTWFSTRTRPAR